MKIAIKVGGSVFCPADKPDMAFVRKLAKALLELSGKHKILVVVGGGRLARKMIEEAKSRGVSSEDELHVIGIEAARNNASVLIKQLGDKAFSGIPRNEQEVAKAFSTGKIVVVGGFRPGQTTDAVTMQSAAAVGAHMVIIGTNVKGIYDRDPNRFKDARFLPELSTAQLMKMSDKKNVKPGEKTKIDPVAVRMMKKTGIKTVVLDIRDMGNMKKAAEGGKCIGTVIA